MHQKLKLLVSRHFHALLCPHFMSHCQSSQVSRIERETTHTNSVLRSHAETIISHAFKIPYSFSEVPS